MRDWLRRLGLTVWTADPTAGPYEPRPLWRRIQVFIGIRGRF